MSAPSTLRLGEDVLARHHHAHVDDLEVVALEHDGDDVLADVVHVALDGGDDDLALGLGLAAGRRPAPSSRPRCRAAGAPPPASSRARSSPPAAGTSCPRRTGRRRCSCRPSAGLRSRAAAGRRSAWIALPGLLGVLDDEVGDAVHQRVRQPLLDRLRRARPAARCRPWPRPWRSRRSRPGARRRRRGGSAPRPRRARAARARGRRRRRPCRR